MRVLFKHYKHITLIFNLQSVKFNVRTSMKGIRCIKLYVFKKVMLMNIFKHFLNEFSKFKNKCELIFERIIHQIFKKNKFIFRFMS